MSCKIYGIVDNTNGNVYIGSTKQRKLSDRIKTHRYHCTHGNKYCSSTIVMKNNDYFYEIIEECDLSIRYERERYYINNTENCINQRKLNGLDKEKRKISKAKYEKNHIRFNAEERKEQAKLRTKFRRSWGDERHHNCLLLIDIDLFK